MTYQYLFRCTNKGYYSTYTPFTCNKPLTQEKANEFMRRHGIAVDRLGANLKMMIDPGGEDGFIITPYYTTYKRELEDIEPYSDGIFSTPEYLRQANEINNDLKYDWLPNDFKDWEIIEDISGNY